MKAQEIGVFVVLLICTFLIASVSAPPLRLMSGITMGLLVVAILKMTGALHNTKRLTGVILGIVLVFACLGFLFSTLLSW